MLQSAKSRYQRASRDVGANVRQQGQPINCRRTTRTARQLAKGVPTQARKASQAAWSK